MINFLKELVVLFCLFGTNLVHSKQTNIKDYNDAKDNYFWNKLYSAKGTSLYCNLKFDNGGVTNVENKKVKLTIEHAYAADWIATANGCANRNACDIDVYKFAEADLHNLWPAHGSINSSRSDLPFAEIPDDAKGNKNNFKRFCSDYERMYAGGDLSPAVEPTNAVKGDIARSLLYMSDEYKLPLHGMKTMLFKWHKEDSVDEVEVWRNKEIFKLQGTCNTYISEC